MEMSGLAANFFSLSTVFTLRTKVTLRLSTCAMSSFLSKPSHQTQPQKKRPPSQRGWSLENLRFNIPYCGGVGATSIGFGGAGAFGAVNPGITGEVAIVPLAASTRLMPYRSSVFARICCNAARSRAYAAVAEISVLSAVAWSEQARERRHGSRMRLRVRLGVVRHRVVGEPLGHASEDTGLRTRTRARCRWPGLPDRSGAPGSRRGRRRESLRRRRSRPPPAIERRQRRRGAWS